MEHRRAEEHGNFAVVQQRVTDAGIKHLAGKAKTPFLGLNTTKVTGAALACFAMQLILNNHLQHLTNDVGCQAPRWFQSSAN